MAPTTQTPTISGIAIFFMAQVGNAEICALEIEQLGRQDLARKIALANLLASLALVQEIRRGMYTPAALRA